MGLRELPETFQKLSTNQATCQRRHQTSRRHVEDLQEVGLHQWEALPAQAGGLRTPLLNTREAVRQGPFLAQ